MEDLSWQADEAIKQSRKTEQQRRLQEHARRKMEKEQGRSKKDSSFAAVRLSSWCFLIAVSSSSTHVSNILVCNGHNTPKERQHYKWYIAFIVYIHVTWGFELVCYLISCLNIFSIVYRAYRMNCKTQTTGKLLIQNYWFTCMFW